MLLAFELSGEHATLPRSEVLASIESLGVDFHIHLSLDGCLIIDLKDPNSEITNILVKRLAMTHHIIEVLGIGGAEEHEIIDMVKDLEIDLHGTYSIRVKRVRDYSKIDTAFLEGQIGGIFYRRGFRADLDKPEKRFRLLLTENRSIFGIVIGSIDRSAFEARKPHYKPFFYPGVLMPRMALALVNIAQPEKNLLDPFCGTGGILIEGGLIGIHVIGGDMQRKLMLGARTNLEYYNIDHLLMYQDARRLALLDNCVDAVVTDPPYGRSAAIKAESFEHLLSASLKEINRVLKAGKRAVLISDRPIEDLALEAGFRIVEFHPQRVHKSLTRLIYVLEKP